MNFPHNTMNVILFVSVSYTHIPRPVFIIVFLPPRLIYPVNGSYLKQSDNSFDWVDYPQPNHYNISTAQN